MIAPHPNSQDPQGSSCQSLQEARAADAFSRFPAAGRRLPWGPNARLRACPLPVAACDSGGHPQVWPGSDQPPTLPCSSPPTGSSSSRRWDRAPRAEVQEAAGLHPSGKPSGTFQTPEGVGGCGCPPQAPPGSQTWEVSRFFLKKALSVGTRNQWAAGPRDRPRFCPITFLAFSSGVTRKKNSEML